MTITKQIERTIQYETEHAGRVLTAIFRATLSAKGRRRILAEIERRGIKVVVLNGTLICDEHNV